MSCDSCRSESRKRRGRRRAFGTGRVPMSSKHTIGEKVSVDEQAIKSDEEEQFEGGEETPELRPSAEQTIQGK
jgi:hypothetical protein